MEHIVCFLFEFSRAFSLIKRALTFFALILCMLSHSQAWEPDAEEFEKLLRALTASALNSGVLTCVRVVDSPCALFFRRPYSLGALGISPSKLIPFCSLSLLLFSFSLNNILGLCIGTGVVSYFLL